MRALTLSLSLLAAPAMGATLFETPPNSLNGSVVELTDVKGPCVGDAKVSIWRARDGRHIPGCYRIEGGMVFIAWLDGDSDNFPAGILKTPTSV